MAIRKYALVANRVSGSFATIELGDVQWRAW